MGVCYLCHRIPEAFPAVNRDVGPSVEVIVNGLEKGY